MIVRLLKKIVIFMLVGLRPLLGPAHCRFEIGCTQFAVNQLQEKPLFHALLAIAKRVLSCNPFSKT